MAAKGVCDVRRTWKRDLPRVPDQERKWCENNIRGDKRLRLLFKKRDTKRWIEIILSISMT